MDGLVCWMDYVKCCLLGYNFSGLGRISWRDKMRGACCGRRWEEKMRENRKNNRHCHKLMNAAAKSRMIISCLPICPSWILFNISFDLQIIMPSQRQSYRYIPKLISRPRVQIKLPWIRRIHQLRKTLPKVTREKNGLSSMNDSRRLLEVKTKIPPRLLLTSSADWLNIHIAGRLLSFPILSRG